MKTIALFGPLGMLGNAVYDALQHEFMLVLVLRDPSRLSILEAAHGGVKKHKVVAVDTEALFHDYSIGFAGGTHSDTWKKLVQDIGEIDGVINCIGVTNRYSQQQPLSAFFVNSAFPHLLSTSFGSKLLHITTDCVYNGIDGGAPYTETSLQSPDDLYGLTKMLGEPSDRSLVLRTSIIGPEVAGFVSLLEWVKKQEGQTVYGFTQHRWNGITTKQYGLIAKMIFSNRDQFPDHGLYHIFSTDVTKYEMVVAIAKKYSVNVKVERDDKHILDRRLRSVKDLNARLGIPSFDEMLASI